MMRLTKIYTRTGDAGKTRLAGGQEVWKHSLRVEAYGTVDELNATLGVVRAFKAGPASDRDVFERLDHELEWVQQKLFDLGGLLATAPGQVFPNMPRVAAEDSVRLERSIDDCQHDLEPLKEFILPGGSPLPASLHLARTVCRRAERICVALAQEEPVDAEIVRFLNRLSDALFVWARWVAKRRGEKEVLWKRQPAG